MIDVDNMQGQVSRLATYDLMNHRRCATYDELK